MNFQNQRLHIFKSVVYSDYVNNLKLIDKQNTELDQLLFESFVHNDAVKGLVQIKSEIVPFEGLISEFYFYNEETGDLNFLFIKVTKNIFGPIWIKKIDYYT
jgi:hypothetical protein